MANPTGRNQYTKGAAGASSGVGALGVPRGRMNAAAQRKAAANLTRMKNGLPPGRVGYNGAKGHYDLKTGKSLSASEPNAMERYYNARQA